MKAGNEMKRWYALRTAPRLECKLMRCLNAAGYLVFCPMQIVFRECEGRTKEVFVPLFPGCIFVEEAAGALSLAASLGAVLLQDEEGRSLSVYADKAELVAKFLPILK